MHLSQRERPAPRPGTFEAQAEKELGQAMHSIALIEDYLRQHGTDPSVIADVIGQVDLLVDETNDAAYERGQESVLVHQGCC